ncbi:MAG: hypothetical protein A3D47_01175 [Candidatus Colwellbacteria bacterium RIFCSPHIGHO2_02_FULL_43_15]|uniref:DUF5808 domain-containing protein n=2 Tax=Candidatus Colwelliibacteriota TaxID=1817904 RepID=A0A1G1Z119_9BACT|nr:MAG: hypothetical protein A3D47_01175 [Candidatus Colwellbacteria bacterium RIFCSPHIGHO2_02_FULL_43_15]OGY61011.1 MAG: hypothetical protein A3F99_00035 [Candidatus Colwellbacteria bacterium RIFCSPLOWO2_12_FULL_43_11]
MRLIKFLRLTSGKNHAIYETDKGTIVRKPIGQIVTPFYWDAKSVIALIAMIIVAALLWSIPVVAWIKF